MKEIADNEDKPSGAQQSDPIPAPDKSRQDTPSDRRNADRDLSSREKIVANICLILWAVFLAVIGMKAVRGTASNSILDMADILVFKTSQRAASSVCPQGKANPPSDLPSIEAVDKLLGCYEETYLKGKFPGRNIQRYRFLAPPVAVVLDRLQINVNWRNAQVIDDVNGDNLAPDSSDYQALFEIVGRRLDAIAEFLPEVSLTENQLKIDNAIIPLKFRSTGSNRKIMVGEFREIKVDMPPEAILWMKLRQDEIAQEKARIEFLNLFILLIILGGFGSWVYLLRRHFEPGTKTYLVEYFYRPPLGMALAIAVFIVNLSLHSLVSSSDINQVRQETLILLAFAAGLLSDKTYEFIEKTVDKKMEEKTGKPS